MIFQKAVYPFPAGEWPPILKILQVRVTRPKSLIQVTHESRDHVIFKTKPGRVVISNEGAPPST